MMVISEKRMFNRYLEDDNDIVVAKIRDKYEKKKVRKKKVNATSNFSYLSLIILFSIFCTILLIQHSRINTIDNEIISLEKELKEVQMINDSKEGSLLSSFNLDAIEKTAKEELGMVEPTLEQYTYLAVENTNLHAENEEDNTIQEARAGGSWFTRFVD